MDILVLVGVFIAGLLVGEVISPISRLLGLKGKI